MDKASVGIVQKYIVEKNIEKIMNIPISKKRFDSLDGIRWVFSLMIVLYHVNGTFGRPFCVKLGFVYQYGGYLGNYFFFMISGFLMAYNYKKQITERNISLRVFLQKRLIKIYPLYVISEIVMITIILIRRGMGGIRFSKCITDGFLMTTGWIDSGNEMPYNYPTWFLCVLILCYIIFYAICKLSRGGEQYVSLIAGMIIFGYAAMRKNWEFPFCYRTDGEGYMNFFLGCLLFEWSEWADKKWNRVAGRLFLISFVIILLGSIQTGFEAFSGDIRLIMTGICLAVMFACLNMDIVRKVFSMYPIRNLGKISMYYYLFHVPLLSIIEEIGKRTGLYKLENRKGLLIFLLLLTVWGLMLQRIEDMRYQKKKMIVD